MKRTFLYVGLVVACGFISTTASAGTIIKLGFSTDSKPDIELLDGLLSTFDDDFGATLGDQNTEVTFLGALSGALAIEGDRASFTLSDVVVSTSPTVIGSTVLQPTEGGTFSLWGPSNELLLSGTLGNGTLSGPTGGTATGGFLTTEFGSFTGGSLLTTLQGSGLSESSLSISLTDVSDGTGFQIDESTQSLTNFTADATANIGGQVPEPAALSLGLLGLLGVLRIRRR